MHPGMTQLTSFWKFDGYSDPITLDKHAQNCLENSNIGLTYVLGSVSLKVMVYIVKYMHVVIHYSIKYKIILE